MKIANELPSFKFDLSSSLLFLIIISYLYGKCSSHIADIEFSLLLQQANAKKEICPKLADKVEGMADFAQNFIFPLILSRVPRSVCYQACSRILYTGKIRRSTHSKTLKPS